MINFGLKTALITGASSGIGREFALSLARKRCWNLILVARNGDRLAQVKDAIENLWHLSAQEDQVLPQIGLVSVDLASEKARSDLLFHLQENGVFIDLLINNAGFACLESFSSSDLDTNQQLIDLHCAAPVHLCRSILASMIERKSGQIINVCSMVASSPMPFVACYAASKAFLLYFTMAIAEEFKSTPIKVLALCPGSTNTPGHSAHTSPRSKNILGIMSPEQVVNAALKALTRPSSICIVGFKNRLLFRMLHIMPMMIAARIQGIRAAAVLRTKA